MAHNTKNKRKSLIDYYKGAFKSWALYVKSYGGLGAMLQSPYLHLSCIVSVICFPVLSHTSENSRWFDIPISVLPDVLGFSLGGYAILLAFGDERFRQLLALPGDEEDEEVTPYMQINGTFVHFIVIQALALIAAVVAKALQITHWIPSILCFLLFVYALFLAIAATFAVMKYIGWYETYIKDKIDQDSDQ